MKNTIILSAFLLSSFFGFSQDDEEKTDSIVYKFTTIVDLPTTVWLCVVWDFETINFQFTANFI